MTGDIIRRGKTALWRQRQELEWCSQKSRCQRVLAAIIRRFMTNLFSSTCSYSTYMQHPLRTLLSCVLNLTTLTVSIPVDLIWAMFNFHKLLWSFNLSLCFHSLHLKLHSVHSGQCDFLKFESDLITPLLKTFQRLPITLRIQSNLFFLFTFPISPCTLPAHPAHSRHIYLLQCIEYFFPLLGMSFLQDLHLICFLLLCTLA